MGPDSEPDGGGGRRVRGLVLKALVVFGGVLLWKKLRKSATRWDHARAVAEALSGEKVVRKEKILLKQALNQQLCHINHGPPSPLPGIVFILCVVKFSREQARRNPDNFFNIRMLTCPATEMADGSKVLYFEQAFWRIPEKPFRQRLYVVKPCPKEMKCDVELSSYAIRDVEEYKNFCDRPTDQRPRPEEVIADIAEHLTTIHLSRCDRGRRCLYEGSSPPGGFPNNWNGASYCTTDLEVHKNGEVHIWDRGFNDEGNQVWGPTDGPYEFKPSTRPSSDDTLFSPLNFPAPLSMEKAMESPYNVNV